MHNMFSIRILGVVSNATQWVSGGILASAEVTEKEISISLPIYITSIIATASFTWIICRYDSRRGNEIHDLKRECEKMNTELKTIKEVGCANRLSPQN